MEITLKKLSEENLENFRIWRMRPDITKYLNTDPVITAEGQLKWFHKIQNDQSQRQWVIYYDDVPIGNLNIIDIDEMNSRCEWGYYVAVKKYCSLQLALFLEMNVYEYAINELGLNKVYSQTFSENKYVLKLHELCGAHRDGVLREHIRKNGEYHDLVMYSMTAKDWNTDKKPEFEKFTFED